MPDIARHPPCPVCAGPVTRRPDEGPGQFGRRRTCSAACHATLRTATSTAATAARISVTPHPPCKQCGAAVVRRQNEPTRTFRLRQFCCGACGRLAGLARCAARREAVHEGAVLVGAADGRQIGLTGQAYAPYDLQFGAGLGRVFRPETAVIRHDAGPLPPPASTRVMT